MRGALHGGLLGLPDLFEVGELALEPGQRLLELLEALLRGLILLLLERLALHLELDDAPLEAVHLLGLGVDLHADARGRLVDQVDRLVRELAVGDVAVRERRRGDDRGIGDLHLVVDRVALLEAAQDRDRVLDRGLAHEHGLEAPLERGVLLDVLAVLVERGRADAVQLAAGQRGLQHVAGVHRALGLAGADHGVQLVDEEDDLAFLFGEVVQHALQPLLELAAELGAGDQRAHVEREDALALEALGHLAVDDALGEALDDRGLADAGLADQHGVVLGAPLQHLDRAADLVVAADDGIELALLRALGEVDREFLQRAALFLGVRVVHLLAAAQVVDGLVDRALHGAGILQHAAERALVLEGGEHEQLARDVLVAALLRELVGDVQELQQLVRRMHLARGALHRRNAADLFEQARAQQADVDAGAIEQGARAAALLVEKREHEVRGLDELLVAADGERLRVRQRQLELGSQSIHAHERVPVDGLPR